MLAQIEATTDRAMLAILLRAAQTWPLEDYEQVEVAFSRRDDVLAAQAAPPPVVAGMNPTLWEVIDTDTRKAKCVKHQVHLVRFDGVSKKPGYKKYVKYNCPVPDPSGKDGKFCRASGFVEEIFGEVK